MIANLYKSERKKLCEYLCRVEEKMSQAEAYFKNAQKNREGAVTK